MKKRYLVLSDGTVFEGRAFGADTAGVGELVFTTSVCGYIETLTDPAYCGQIILQTFPLLGNYGVIESDFEGECLVRGVVARQWCETPSNFRSQYDIDSFLKAKGVPGICDLDTRALTAIIREKGVMNAMICDEIPASLDEIKAYSVKDAVSCVTVKEEILYPAKGEKRFSVSLVDLGVRKSVIDSLCALGCEVRRLPAGTPAEQILEGCDGIMLSDGPGNPEDNASVIEEIKKLAGKKPLFAAGLGHSLLALAMGGKVEKLPHGHHGGNLPVKETNGKNTHITGQNHNYAVAVASVPAGVMSYVNANDGTCEGMDYPEHKAFSVQFHPEIAAQHRITAAPFERFVSMMEEDAHAAE